MKANIKDDQNEQKKDFANLATIKKSEKVGNSKISEAKKIAINQAVIDATNQTRDATQSASNANLFSHFTNPQKAFTPLASPSVVFSKDPGILGNASTYCNPFVFGQPGLAPRTLQKDLISNTSDLNPFSSTLQTMEEISTTSLNDSLKQQSSTIVKPPMQINFVPTSLVTAEPIEKNIITLNNSLNNQQSIVTVRPSMKINGVTKTINLSQSVGAQLVEEDTATLGDSLNIQKSLNTVRPSMKITDGTKTGNTLEILVNEQLLEESNTTLSDSLNIQKTSTNVKPSMQKGFVPNMVNALQSAADIEPMEQNGMFDDDLLQTEEHLNIMPSSIKNNSCRNLNSEKFVIVVQTEEENNTRQVRISPAQPKLKNVDTVKSPSIKKIPVSVPSPVQSCSNNLPMTRLLSMSTQTEVSDVTSCVSKKDKILNSQSTPTKGVKRKAEEIVNKGKNSGNTGNNKKNKNKQKFILPQFLKKFKKCTKGQNSPATSHPKSLICAIVEEQYPNMPPLTDVHLGIIRNMIKEKIDSLPFGVFIPKFMHAFIKNGVILVECADNNSKEWLKSVITNYNPREGVYLKVIPPEAVNQYYPASIFVHDEVNAVDVLRRMQKQNSDVSIRNWQYLSMIIVKESTPGITINVGIPATSMAQLKAKNFKLFHAMDQVTVIMKVVVPF